MQFQPSRSFAESLDLQDPLAPLRAHFLIPDADLIYLDGNSLGRLSKASFSRIQVLVEKEWGHDLVRGWNNGWWQAPIHVGEKIARLVGAAPNQVVACDTVSVNLFKLAFAALSLRPYRTHIITDTLNFPSDLYVLQGLIHYISPTRCSSTNKEEKYIIQRISSKDGDITPDLEELTTAINENTALVTLSHVTFKSGYLYDMAAITEVAHKHGALVLWDLSHSVGSVPVELDACQADFAIGCTYKYLNGGPGSPAFLYVSKGLQEQMVSPIWGWWGQNSPFTFDLDYTPAPGVARFLTGSQPVLSLLTMEAALDPLLDTGMEALRAKSIVLGDYLIYLFDTILAPYGFALGSPRDQSRRGSHISLRHPEGYRINRALIEEMKVLPDFRAPDNLRLGLAPIYTRFVDVWDAVNRIRQVMGENIFQRFPATHETVT